MISRKKIAVIKAAASRLRAALDVRSEPMAAMLFQPVLMGPPRQVGAAGSKGAISCLTLRNEPREENCQPGRSMRHG